MNQLVGLDIDGNNIEKFGMDSSDSGYVPIPGSCEP